jgi:hypothetical protein
MKFLLWFGVAVEGAFELLRGLLLLPGRMLRGPISKSLPG